MEELKHYGVLGMKWGVRKEREQAIREKASKILSRHKSSGGIHLGTDKQRIEYMSKPLSTRIGKTLKAVTAQLVVGEILSGNFAKYGNLSKTDVAKKLTKVAATVVANVALNDTLAKSAMKRYSDEGKRIGKSKIITREDIIQTSVGVGLSALPVAKMMLGMKAFQLNKERVANESKVNQWGGRLLEAPIGDIIGSFETFDVLAAVKKGG